MENKKEFELNDDVLDAVSGGLTTDSVSEDDTLGVPAILNPFDEYAQNSC